MFSKLMSFFKIVVACRLQAVSVNNLTYKAVDQNFYIFRDFGFLILSQIFCYYIGFRERAANTTVLA
jgi:hypothetical protein